MKIIYEPERDTMRVLLSDAPIQSTSAACPGTLLDFDHRGRLVGIEITPASEFIPEPAHLETVAITVRPPTDQSEESESSSR